MRLTGWKFPVVIDGEGVKLAAASIPIYAPHAPEGGPDVVECLVGQTGTTTVVQGCIKAEGIVTGESTTVKNVLAHARNGFKWQASINAMPTKVEFLLEGRGLTVNGKAIVGPCVVARAVTMDHIALVPLGADPTTSACIAASQPAGKDGTNMEFAAWLEAKYSMDTSTLTDEQKAKFTAEFNADAQRIAAAANGGGTKIDTKVAGGDGKISAAGGDGANGGASGYAAYLEAQTRISAIEATFAKPEYASLKPAQVATLKASAVKDGWSVDRIELEVLRASRQASDTIQGKGDVPGLPGGPSVGAISARAPLPAAQAWPNGYPDMSARQGGRWLPTEGGADANAEAAILEAEGLISCGRAKNGQGWDEILAKDPRYGERIVQKARERMRYDGTCLGPMGFLKAMAAQHGMREFPHSNVDSFEQIIRAAFTSFALPVALSNLMNKLLMDGYYNVDPNGIMPGTVAWQQFARRGPVNDFKPHYRVRLIGNHRPKALKATGEIEHGQFGEQTYKIQASVKALMEGISYQDIINDDLSVFSAIPTQAGVGCGEQVAEDVYTALLANLQSDGATAFFTATDALAKVNRDTLSAMAKNLLTGSALTVDTLGTAWSQFLKQVKPNGTPLGQMPKILLVPPGLAVTAMAITRATQLIPTAIATTGAGTGSSNLNVMSSLGFRAVCSQYLGNATITGYSATSWYLMAEATDNGYPIEVAFLNGQEMPIIERDEMSFDRLGIGYRWWLSYGVGMGEPRSAVLCQA